ncbi:VanZ family protein [Paenibacillus sp. UMB7766-LJ446]|uniref:VanZ family protein n=1 Tax=Paenibacillus sp. UMB7766-LJ446 TaxID=3046313 RepID=UPI00255122E7|nr:VanZ family protein [Paenibacillus sp. UMB7766-LJ446]MDK8193894.1 VanZ family protein [Paenibacillus sp. UMB7766-LJ446]
MSVQYTITSLSILGPLFFLVLIALVFYTRVYKIRYTARQYILVIAFIVYLFGVMHFVFFPIDINIGIYANQTPWYKTLQWIPLLTADAPSFALNILLFIPLGFMLPLLKPWAHSVRTAAIAGLTLSLLIEMLQLLIRVTLGNGRSTDINDLIANTAGSVLGYVTLNLFTKWAAGQLLMTSWRLKHDPLHKYKH